MMMFINKKDSLRKEYKVGTKDIERSVRKNHRGFKVPMPSIGESICKIRDKCKEDSNEAFKELIRLLDRGFFNVSYINNPHETFTVARNLSEVQSDSRDTISPMDALILAVAIIDPNCRTFYTSDRKLTFNSKLLMEIDEWRNNLGHKPLRIHDIKELLT